MRTANGIGHVLVACAAVLLGFAMSDARATELTCGQVVMGSATLESDLTCFDTALFIGASGVTIDLGGHTIFGPAYEGVDSPWSGIRSLPGTSLSHLRITNGTIVGFEQGIALVDVSRVLIQRMVIRDQFPGTGGRAKAVAVTNGSDVEVETVVAIGPTTQQAGGIALDGVTHAAIRRSYVRGFWNGIGFRCSDPRCASGALANSGIVEDNTVVDSGNTGIGVSLADDLKVSGNHLSNIVGAATPTVGGAGIAVAFGGPTTRLRIVGNSVDGSVRGIAIGPYLTESKIDGNVFVQNATGISIGPEPRGNVIESNVALDNAYFDIYNVTGPGQNRWDDNICRTPVNAAGGDVTCDPMTP